MPIYYDNHSRRHRIVNAVAAYEQVKGPVIVDFARHDI
jgi:hypothetical protein